MTLRERLYQQLEQAAETQGDLFGHVMTHSNRMARVYLDLTANYLGLVVECAAAASGDLGLLARLNRALSLLEELGEAYVDITGDCGQLAEAGVRNLELWRGAVNLSEE